MQTGLKIATNFEPPDKYRVSWVEKKLKLISNLTHLKSIGNAN